MVNKVLLESQGWVSGSVPDSDADQEDLFLLQRAVDERGSNILCTVSLGEVGRDVADSVYVLTRLESEISNGWCLILELGDFSGTDVVPNEE